MKVNHSNAESVKNSVGRQVESASRSKETRRSGRGETARESGRVNSDVRAEVSSKAKEMSKAKAAAAQAPDIREEKIAKLKAMIESGQYKMPTNEAIADRLVDEHMKSAGI
jgi:negative regulator of flagellin synthesis FlgM